MTITELLLQHIILKILEKMSVLLLFMQFYFGVFFLYSHYDTDFISCFTFSAVAHSVWSQKKKVHNFSLLYYERYTAGFIYTLSMNIFFGT